MILAIVKLRPRTDRRHEVRAILETVTGPTQAEPGCLGCVVLEERGEEESVLLVEKWQTGDDLNRHLRSPLYSRILEAMELCREPPDVTFHEISATSGMEVIRALRESASKCRQ